jgi:hypothetical protein
MFWLQSLWLLLEDDDLETKRSNERGELKDNPPAELIANIGIEIGWFLLDGVPTKDRVERERDRFMWGTNSSHSIE